MSKHGVIKHHDLLRAATIVGLAIVLILAMLVFIQLVAPAP